MNMQSSTLKFDETGEALHLHQAAQIRAFGRAWKEAGHARTPRISVSRSIFPLLDDQDVFTLGAQVRTRTRLAFWTRARERSLAVAMLPSRKRLSISFGKM